MKKELRSEIEIDAPKSEVWKILTNFQEYDEWNPFIYPIEGELSKGSRLFVLIHLQDAKPQAFRPRIKVLVPEQKLAWLGSFLIIGLFDGEHYFHLEELPGNKTRLIHGEKFSGILSGMVLKSIETKILQGFEAMNEALKERVESQLAGNTA